MPGIYIGNSTSNSKSINWSSYWKSLKTLDYTSMSGLDLVEVKSGLNAKILPSIALVDADNYAIKTVSNFASTVASGYVICRFYLTAEGIAGNVRLFSSVDQGVANTRYFSVSMSSGKPLIFIREPVTSPFNHSCIADSALTEGWYIIKFESVGGHYKITINGSELTVGAGLTMTLGTDDGKWINLVTLRDNISIGAWKAVSTYGSALAYIDYVDFNGTNKWIGTGEGDYFYDIIGDEHMTWTGAAHVFNSILAGTHCLDTGYSLWIKTGEVNEYVPYASAGVPDDPSAFLVGYTKYQDYPGSITKYNKAPSLIGFNETEDADSKLEIFDRSNTTRQTATSRASAYYSATSLATKSRYHSSEFDNFETLQTYFNTGYQYLIWTVHNTILIPTTLTFKILSTNLTDKFIESAYLATKNPLLLKAYGDSITRGYDATNILTERWSYLVAQNKELRELNYGVDSSPLQTAVPASGTSFESLYASVLYDYKTKYLILAYGILDDYLASTSAAGFETLLDTILNTLINTNLFPASSIVLLNMTITTAYGAGDVAKYNAINSHITTKGALYGCKVIDITTYLTDNGGMANISGDNIHPNTTGFGRMADKIIADL